jgi:hypothetical protein
VTAQLAAAAVPFDVVMFPDGVTAADRVSAEALHRYDTLVLPQVTHLTAQQAAAVRGYLDGGGRVVVVGELATNLHTAEREALLHHAGVTHAGLPDGEAGEGVDALLPGGRQVRVGTVDVGTARVSTVDVAVNVARLPGGSAAVHLVSYGYDEQLDRVTPVAGVELSVRLPIGATSATVVTSDGKRTDVEVAVDGDTHTLRLQHLGLYTIVVLPALGERPTA